MSANDDMPAWLLDASLHLAQQQAPPGAMQEPKPEAQSRLPRMPWAPPRRPPSGSASRFTAQRRRPPATAAGNSKLSLVDASLDFWHCAELETDVALQRRVEDAAEFAQVYLDWKRASGKRVPFGASQVLHCLTAQKKLKVKKVEGGASDGSASTFAVVVFAGTSAAEATQRVRVSRAAFEEDKHGVKVDPLCFDEPVAPHTTAERRLGIKNGGGAAVTLQGVRLVRGTTGFSASPDCKLPFKLAAGKGYAEVVVRVTPAQRGLVCDTLCLAAGSEWRLPRPAWSHRGPGAHLPTSERSLGRRGAAGAAGAAVPPVSEHPQSERTLHVAPAGLEFTRNKGEGGDRFCTG